MPPAGTVQAHNSHWLANLVQGVVGLGLTCFGGFWGAVVGIPLMVDAFADWTSGKGIWGWLTGSNTRSLASELVEGLPMPVSVGVSVGNRYAPYPAYPAYVPPPGYYP